MVPNPDSDLVRFIYAFETETKILGMHVPDHTGHCTGCTAHQLASPVSPCDLHNAATRVVALRAAGQAPVLPKPVR